MDIGIIAKRYASAWLQYAKEQQAEEANYAEAAHCILTWQKVPEAMQVLCNPTLQPAKKVQLLCEAASKTSCSAVFRKFAELVVAHHREAFMLYIAHSYILLYRQDKHISIGHLKTAVPVTDEVKQRLEQWIEEQGQNAQEVIMQTEVDPSILGGFIFRIDDYRLDASVATQFELIKTQIIEKNKRIV